MAEEVARITGKEVGSAEGAVAAIHCARCLRADYEKYDYIGYGNCSAANIAFAGPTDCDCGCVGFGECANACPFNAIVMTHHFPVVDECVYSVNCLVAAADLAKGKTPEAILDIDADAIRAAIGDLPTDHRHCASLAADTLHSAIDGYMKNHAHGA